MIRTTTASIVCLLLLSEYTYADVEKRQDSECCQNLIVGGADANINDVPYQSSLIANNRYFCGASIVSNKFVITAAHCVFFFFRQRFYEHQQIYLRVGSNYTDRGGVLAAVKSSTCHPKFNFDTYDYDVCATELLTPLNFTRSIQPVKIADFEPEGGEVGRIAGWGTLWENGKSPDKLQSVEVSVTNKTRCREAYEKISPVTERMICAGTEGKDSCQGDSGGGLVVSKTLVGVISTGYGCGVKNYPGVYTSLAHPEIRSFIKNITGV